MRYKNKIFDDMKSKLKSKRLHQHLEESNIYVGNLKNSAKNRPKLDFGEEQVQPQSMRCIPPMNFQGPNKRCQKQLEKQSSETPTDQPSSETCVYCSNEITQEQERKEEKVLLQSTDCFHFIHKKCLLTTAQKEFIKRNGIVKCPEKRCQKTIQEWELKSCF